LQILKAEQPPAVNANEKVLTNGVQERNTLFSLKVDSKNQNGGETKS
jgi:hypothetical protein